MANKAIQKNEGSVCFSIKKLHNGRDCWGCLKDLSNYGNLNVVIILELMDKKKPLGLGDLCSFAIYQCVFSCLIFVL